MKITVNCDNCGKPVERYASKISKNVYCSHECMHVGKRSKYDPQIMAALPTEPGISAYDLEGRTDINHYCLKERLRILYVKGLIHRQDSCRMIFKWVYWRPA